MVKPVYCIVFLLLLLSCGNASHASFPIVESKPQPKPVVDLAKTKQKAKQALVYCIKHHYNTNFCLLLDMSLHSGVNRFFVWNFKTDTIQYSGLVSHGCGENPWGRTNSSNSPLFSNIKDSHCSSLGRYKVSNRSNSEWGIHVMYYLYGKDTTNSNALAREIVFHSWNKVSDSEVYPAGTPEGWGCPAVSDNTMAYVDALLKVEPKPTLMWMYNQ